MSQDKDVEEGDVEKELDKIERDASNETSTPATPRPPDAIFTPYHQKEYYEEEPPRGRLNSRGSVSSHDSERTLSDTAHDHQVPPHRSRSRGVSSTRSVPREAERVPRNERRGLLARLAIIPEVTSAYDYPRKTKWVSFRLLVLFEANDGISCQPLTPGVIH